MEDEGLKTGAGFALKLGARGGLVLIDLAGMLVGGRGGIGSLSLSLPKRRFKRPGFFCGSGVDTGMGAGAATVFGLLGAKSFRSRPDSGMMPPASDKSGSAKVCLAAGLKSATGALGGARGGAPEGTNFGAEVATLLSTTFVGAVLEPMAFGVAA